MLDFPSSPSVGQKYPQPAIAGAPVYAWDGEKWTTKGGALTPGASPSASNPIMDSVAFPGVATTYARGDHVHPSDTTRAPLASPTFTGALTASTVNITGNATFGSVTMVALYTVSGAGSLAGLTANLLTVNGLATMGPVTANAKMQAFGNPSGVNVQVSPPVSTDANILLYNHTAGSWAGMGTDGNGTFWVKTGYNVGQRASFFIDGNQITQFLNSPYSPHPTAGDNSTRIATTHFVRSRVPSGSYLPLTGGTIQGNLVVQGDLRTYRSDGTGVIFFNAAQTAYLYYNGPAFNFTHHVYSANGRLWGANDFANPVSNGRLTYVADYAYGANAALAEPYPGAIHTGCAIGAMATSGNPITYRYRYAQLLTSSWFTIGTA